MQQIKFDLVSVLKTRSPKHLNMVVGFDGFVDEIIHVVDKRLDSEHFTRIETINTLAQRIAKASGLSTNIELFPVQKKIGGNGPIMCNALARHQSQITYIGALGYPSVDDVFSVMASDAKLYSIAQNGHTDALEFHDGKLMLGKMASLNHVTFDQLIKTVGMDTFVSLLNEADLFANVNWSMIPHMTDLWKSILMHICPLITPKEKKGYFFVDLADPEKRPDEEIIEALDLLKLFKPYFKVILGLNKKEAYDVAKVFNLFDNESLENMQVSIKDLNTSLYKRLEIDAVVIHPVDRSCVVIDGVFYEALGPYVTRPKLTTGAGDNFNAGFVLGLMLDLNPLYALLTGMATSGFYVRNACSPTYDELIEFIDDWASEKV